VTSSLVDAFRRRIHLLCCPTLELWSWNVACVRRVNSPPIQSGRCRKDYSSTNQWNRERGQRRRKARGGEGRGEDARRSGGGFVGSGTGAGCRYQGSPYPWRFLHVNHEKVTLGEQRLILWTAKQISLISSCCNVLSMTFQLLHFSLLFLRLILMSSLSVHTQPVLDSVSSLLVIL
jgi:hypothetical protein